MGGGGSLYVHLLEREDTLKSVTLIKICNVTGTKRQKSSRKAHKDAQKKGFWREHLALHQSGLVSPCCSLSLKVDGLAPQTWHVNLKSLSTRPRKNKNRRIELANSMEPWRARYRARRHELLQPMHPPHPQPRPRCLAHLRRAHVQLAAHAPPATAQRPVRP